MAAVCGGIMLVEAWVSSAMCGGYTVKRARFLNPGETGEIFHGSYVAKQVDRGMDGQTGWHARGKGTRQKNRQACKHVSREEDRWRSSLAKKRDK